MAAVAMPSWTTATIMTTKRVICPMASRLLTMCQMMNIRMKAGLSGCFEILAKCPHFIDGENLLVIQYDS